MQQDKIFDGQIAVVTGGTRGIGAAISEQLADSGATVVMIYRSDDHSAQAQLKKLSGENHSVLKADLSAPDQVSSLVDSVIQRYGAIDILVNNAGIAYHHPIDQVDYAEWQSSWQNIMNINLIGPSNMCHQVSQAMIRQGRGHIINVSSRGAFRGEPLMAAYGASKAGLNSMTQSLAYALAPHGIFVGGVAPGDSSRRICPDHASRAK